MLTFSLKKLIGLIAFLTLASAASSCGDAEGESTVSGSDPFGKKIAAMQKIGDKDKKQKRCDSVAKALKTEAKATKSAQICSKSRKQFTRWKKACQRQRGIQVNNSWNNGICEGKTKTSSEGGKGGKAVEQEQKGKANNCLNAPNNKLCKCPGALSIKKKKEDGTFMCVKTEPTKPSLPAKEAK